MALHQLKQVDEEDQEITPALSLTADEESRLSRRWRTLEDHRALERMISSHLGLVVNIALKFRNSGPAMDDLIQEGNVGLTIAARRFDPGQGARLATYATYWIRACMMGFVVRSHGPVRLGTTRAQRKIFFGMGRARRTIERTGQRVSSEAIADALGVEEEEVESMAMRLSSRDVSLDAPRNPGDDREYGSLLSDASANSEDQVGNEQEHAHRKARLLEGFSTLDPRERAILEARHMSEEPATLESLGKRLRLSRERVRQIESRAVAKLRAVC
jgi:RNA polymerase sigma-32 factor